MLFAREVISGPVSMTFRSFAQLYMVDRSVKLPILEDWDEKSIAGVRRHRMSARWDSVWKHLWEACG